MGIGHGTERCTAVQSICLQFNAPSMATISIRALSTHGQETMQYANHIYSIHHTDNTTNTNCSLGKHTNCTQQTYYAKRTAKRVPDKQPHGGFSCGFVPCIVPKAAFFYSAGQKGVSCGLSGAFSSKVSPSILLVETKLNIVCVLCALCMACIAAGCKIKQIGKVERCMCQYRQLNIAPEQCCTLTNAACENCAVSTTSIQTVKRRKCKIQCSKLCHG